MRLQALEQLGRKAQQKLTGRYGRQGDRVLDMLSYVAPLRIQETPFRRRLAGLPHSEYLWLCTGTHVMRNSSVAAAGKITQVLVNSAGGDLPMTLQTAGNEAIMRAAEEISRNGGYEYAIGAKEEARMKLAHYFKLVPNRIFFAGGLSSFSRELFEKHHIIHKSRAMAVHAACSHPLFYQDAHFNLGRHDVLEIRRKANGEMDLDHLEEQLEANPGRKFLVSIVPYENPIGIIYTREFIDRFFGILGKHKKNVWLYLDCMYHDFCFTENPITIQELVRKAEEHELVGAIGVGLSKIMLSPGSRGAGVGIFGSRQEVEELLLFLKRWETSTINSGVSNNTLAALAAAFSDREDVRRGIEATREEVRKRVYVNRETLLSTEGVLNPYPDAELQCAFYLPLMIENDKWANETYAHEVWAWFLRQLDSERPKLQRWYVENGFNTDEADFDMKIFVRSREILAALSGKKEPALRRDECFVIDLMRKHGIALAPGSLFFEWDSPYRPLSEEGAFPFVRSVLSWENEKYVQISNALAQMARS